MDDLPFRAEYAKSGRASCKTCKQKIEKEDLRLAVMVQSPMFDGKVPHWYHFACFFVRQRVASVGDISHFESLRWDDQEKIRAKVAEGPTAKGSAKASGVASAKKASKRKSTKKESGLNDYSIEYAKSSRATCRGCEDKIAKSEIRVSKMDHESDEARRYGGIPLWHHLDCFAKKRQELEFCECGSELPGFKLLNNEDQDKVMELLPKMEPVKIKEEIKDEPDGLSPEKKPKIDDNDIVRKQNQELFKYRDHLKSIPKKELIALLEYNNQDVPSGVENILDRLADAMTFGVLKRCEECKHGQLVFRSGVGYFCLGHKDEWMKCESVFENPAKKPFKIPDEMKEEYPFLKAYKYKEKKRIFQTNAPSKSVVAKNIKSEPKIERNLPLKHMEFVLRGTMGKEKRSQFKIDIVKMGGTVTTKVHPNTTAIITTKSHFEKRNDDCIDDAESYDIQVVPESFLEECKEGNAVMLINKMNMASWGKDPSARISATTKSSKSGKSKSTFTSNLPSKVKLKVRDGLAVDPDSGLEDITHVYKHKDDVYNAVLSLADVQSGKNSYYKMQILESAANTYWLFRSWGRIGTTIGGTKCVPMERNAALNEFRRLFEEKTGNMWIERHHFVKVPGKMVPVDVSYQDETPALENTSNVSSTLAKPVQDLMSLIFNVNAMKNAMLEFELDMEKMPLGKLSKQQIKAAYSVLTTLQNILQDPAKKADRGKLISSSNKFYTLMPHDCGLDNPPILDSVDQIKQKVDMLDALLEIEIAYSILQESDNTIDAHYLKLNATIDVLDPETNEYNMIKTYIQNTHADTHRNYDLQLIQVFKVNRSGEDKKFKPFKKLHNRKLLWHGSRTTNFAGILSQGLRIAPPEAPSTGYMFGKGVYFADMVSKSANYCNTSSTNDTGLLLLCEVALGDMYERLAAEFVKKLPPGKHSCKGAGKTEPDPKGTIKTADGVEVPLGKPVPSAHQQSSLLYNEYIVYDVAQIKSDSSDLDDILLANIISKRKECNSKRKKQWIATFRRDRELLGEYHCLVPKLSSEEFRRYLRLTTEQFEEIHDLIKSDISKQHTFYRRTICSRERLTVCLRFLATGQSYRELGFSFRIGESTISNIVQEVCASIWNKLQPLYMPTPTKEFWVDRAHEFTVKWNFPNCLSAIDGRHMVIKKPIKSGTSFFNYKKTFSVVLLAGADANYKFTFIDVGSKGRFSDGYIFAHSNFVRKLKNNSLNIPIPMPIAENGDSFPFVFVADAAFPLQQNSMRPYPGSRTKNDTINRIFNYRLSRARQTVECAFGILTVRWRVYRKPMEIKVETVDKIIKSTCTLHNYLQCNAMNAIEVEHLDALDFEEPEQQFLHLDRSRARSTAVAFNTRENFTNYFCTEGAVSWQDKYVGKGKY